MRQQSLDCYNFDFLIIFKKELTLRSLPNPILPYLALMGWEEECSMLTQLTMMLASGTNTQIKLAFHAAVDIATAVKYPRMIEDLSYLVPCYWMLMYMENIAFLVTSDNFKTDIATF